MPDDVLLAKAATIERCLKRVKDVFTQAAGDLESNITAQDSIVLNIERACQATIDAAIRIVRIRGLGLPRDSRDAFHLLQLANILPPTLSVSLQKMVGFRNRAVHDYSTLDLERVRRLILDDFADLREFARILVQM